MPAEEGKTDRCISAFLSTVKLDTSRSATVNVSQWQPVWWGSTQTDGATLTATEGTWSRYSFQISHWTYVSTRDIFSALSCFPKVIVGFSQTVQKHLRPSIYYYNRFGVVTMQQSFIWCWSQALERYLVELVLNISQKNGWRIASTLIPWSSPKIACFPTMRQVKLKEANEWN